MSKFKDQRIKVAAILIKKYKYMPLQLKSLNNDYDDDIYLINPYHPNYQTICLSLKDKTTLIPIQLGSNEVNNQPFSGLIIYFNNKNEEGIVFNPHRKDDTLQKYYPDIYSNFFSISLFTKIIMAICIIVFGIGLFLATQMQYYASVLIILGANYGPFIYAAYDFIRFLTAMFVHLDFLHLACNLMSLYYLANFLEKRNKIAFRLILFLSSIVGNMLLYIVDSSCLAAGLSAGLYGLLGWYVVIFIKEKQYRYKNQLSLMIYLATINIFISLMPSVSFFGHLGGLFMGILLGMCFEIKRSDLVFHFKVVSVISFLIIGYFTFKVRIPEHVYYLNDLEVIRFYHKLKIPFYPEHLEQSLFKLYGEVAK